MTQEQKKQAFGYAESGMDTNQIAAILMIDKRTIEDFLSKPFTAAEERKAKLSGKDKPLFEDEPGV
jgi:hypothetical protein